MTMLFAAKLLVAYLLGSLSGSLMLGKLRGVDIRTLGSGNAGGTNALRTQGWRFGLGVMLIDVAKGVLAGWLGLQDAGSSGLLRPLDALLMVALACVGHVFPIYHGFRGGKGAAVLVGGYGLLAPWCLLLALSVWLFLLLCFGYVGPATVVAIAVVPLASWFLVAPAWQPTFAAISALLALFVAWTHRDNLRRLAAGNENRFERARLIGRWLERRRRSAGT
jgi:glycerol-3-phosphate acyltransferase PlsY